MATELTERILRDIQQRLTDALANAERDRTLAHRAIIRVDQVEARLDTTAADIRSIRADITKMIRRVQESPVLAADSVRFWRRKVSR
jgi:hypothetical protein